MKKFVVYVCLLSLPSYAQQQQPLHANHTPVTNVRGDKHPEKVSDQRAWLMQMIALTSTERDSDVVQQHTALHRKVLGLDDEQSTLDAARVHYEQLIADYNAGPQTAVGRAKLTADIDGLVQELVNTLNAHMPPQKWRAITYHVQESKKKIGYTVDHPQPDDTAELTSAVYHPGKARLVRSSGETILSGNSAGYTYSTVLDTDGTNWYQTAYISGTSDAQWTCVWDQYHQQWQPPGCPARHDFYLTNQINGNGTVDLYVGGQQSPTQYISYSYGNISPVQNLTQEQIYTGVKVVCSVAKVILVTYFGLFVKSANTFFDWDGTQSWLIPNVELKCYVNKNCDNTGQRYAVDGDGVYVFGVAGYSPSCSAAYNCRGFCTRSIIGGVWTCPSDLPSGIQFAYCPAITKAQHYGQCTVHP